MWITSDRSGYTDDGKFIPSGTTVLYLGHVVGGMIRVRTYDRIECIMHPVCFPNFR